MKHNFSAALLARWADASKNDPPPNPVALREQATHIRREHFGIADLIERTGAQRVRWTMGTRWEKFQFNGHAYTAEPINEAETAAIFDGLTDWRRNPAPRRGTCWSNHVAQARILDGELIILVNREAFV